MAVLDEVVAPTTAARLLGCSLSTVYRHVQHGYLRTRHRHPIGIEAAHLTTMREALSGSVDVAEAARRLGLPRHAVFRLVYSGQLQRQPMPHRSMRITSASLERHIAARAP